MRQCMKENLRYNCGGWSVLRWSGRGRWQCGGQGVSIDSATSVQLTMVSRSSSLTAMFAALVQRFVAHYVCRAVAMEENVAAVAKMEELSPSSTIWRKALGQSKVKRSASN